MKRKTGKLMKKKVKKILTGIELLTSKGYRASYKSTAETYCKQPLQFKMLLNAGSFTSVNDKGQTLMNIDLNMFRDDKFSTSHYHLFAKGVILHESGHVLYSDFDVIRKNADNVNQLRNQIKAIGEAYYQESDPILKQDCETKLYDAILEFTKASNLPDVLNSFEDAAVERVMSEMGKDENGSIAFTRNYFVEKDTQHKLDAINNDAIPLDSDNWNQATLDGIITEARLMATAGYRMAIDMTIISHTFEPAEINQIKDICQYVRFMSNTTEDRNISSEVFLDMCQPIIEKIAQDLTNAYIRDIDYAEDQLNNMQQNANASTQSTGGSGSQPTQAGGNGLPGQKGGSQPQPTSNKNSLPLPDSLKKQLQNKANQTGQLLSVGGQGSNQGDASHDGQGADGAGTGNENNNATSGGGAGDGPNGTSISNATKTDEELSDESVTDMTEALNNAKKTFQRNEDMVQDSLIKSDHNIRAAEGRCHKGIGISITDINDVLDLSDSREGKEAQKTIQKDNLNIYVNELSKKIKKVLMRKGMDDTSRGRYEGDIDFSNLHRIKTDCQLFKKDIEGKTNKIRFAILVDESGSMYGTELYNAILGCWMIAKAAQKLKIPFAVYGHDEDDEFELRKYISYEKCKKNTALNSLFKMSSRGCNRDGLAIFHVCRELIKHAQDDEDLYFIILSDGQPNGYNYGGQPAIDDMREVINTFKKHYNVHSIGIGIGDFNFENIGVIYDNHVCVKDVKELPNEMFKIFKQILKVER